MLNDIKRNDLKVCVNVCHMCLDNYNELLSLMTPMHLDVRHVADTRDIVASVDEV